MFQKTDRRGLSTFAEDGEVYAYRGLLSDFGHKRVYAGVMPRHDNKVLIRGYFREGSNSMDPESFYALKRSGNIEGRRKEFTFFDRIPEQLPGIVEYFIEKTPADKIVELINEEIERLQSTAYNPLLESPNDKVNALRRLSYRLDDQEKHPSTIIAEWKNQYAETINRNRQGLVHSSLFGPEPDPTALFVESLEKPYPKRDVAVEEVVLNQS